MTTPTYKYIKGTEILSTEHMLSATELASFYGLLTVNNKPNAVLVTQILEDSSKPLFGATSASDFYFPHSHGVIKVYPRARYNILDAFVQSLKEGKVYEYGPRNTSKQPIKYKYKMP